MTIKITLTGFDNLAKAVDPDRLRAELAKVPQQGAAALRDLTKRMPPVSVARTGYGAKGIPVAPVRGGTLRQSIQSRKLSMFAAGVYTDKAVAGYGGYVHGGTRKMQARPFFEWALNDFGGKDILEKILQQSLQRFLSP